MKEELLALLQGNPFLSQQELADQLGLSRSAVAGHIAALTRERRILGRAYVLPQRRPIVCVGGTNLDRKLRLAGPLVMGSSNPVEGCHESAGGVARNVAENLARLGLPVHLLTALGQDGAGQALLQQLQQLGVGTDGSLLSADQPTPSYTAVLDARGQMQLALAHMGLCERLDADFLRHSAAQRAAAAMRVMDLNLPAATQAALIAEARADGVPLVAVAVSVAKMARLPQRLDGLALLILNRDELAARCGLALKKAADWQAALAQLRGQGLARVIVTQGRQGLRFADRDGGWSTLAAEPVAADQLIDVTGAGDAFSAGVCAALSQNPEDLAAACRLGQRLSALTLRSSATVSPELSPALLAP
ncbi:winged helix-turn-helix transcriptional regulator [Pelomonas sp. CA6]|uniref:carbohydrate kinase n=1 Tax=Pelomonas sp. CA6 TaxID=2907999 RepID=UPI001F4B4660|nr:carbohydrate kinase [Pelomonas sp. CA6]MCH7342946.1 winged helix-turn-helix transcriptional regulator [Pelomonas sp. CA6]